MPRKPARTVAPWVRTRLRTAPGAALAYGLLVLVTAFLTAAVPRAVDAYETEGLWHAVAAAEPRDSALTLSTTVPASLKPEQQRLAFEPVRLRALHERLLPLLPAPLRADPGQSVYGARATKRLAAPEEWLPRPDGVDPEFFLDAPSGLAEHSRLTAGRMPRTTADGGMEAAVTTTTAATLRLKPGAVLHLPGTDGTPEPITVTGVVEPRDATAPYWATDPGLHTPTTEVTKGTEPRTFWVGTLLLAPESAPGMLDALTEPELYWRYAPDVRHLTAEDTDRLSAAVTSASDGPGAVAIREVLGPGGTFATDLDRILAGYAGTRSAIAAVVAVAVFGIGAVAVVVLAMTGGLLVARRHHELALMRSRGASLPGIGVRVLGETATVAVPAAALGLLLALPLTGGAGSRPLPACLGAATVAAVAALMPPLRAVFLHRRPQLHGARDDLVTAKPSARRTIVELTFLALAAAAVVALRRRGTDDSGDYLVSAAPVLVGLIAAFVLVRLYPLPLRWAARPARRLRGAVGFLALARAGRSAASGALPLLALLVALTTAAFGGAVLSGVSDARDRAAYRQTGADAQVAGDPAPTPLPPGVAEKVRGVAGVGEVSPVQVEFGVGVPSGQGTADRGMTVPLLGVEPASYARLAARTGFGAFPAELLKSTGTGGPEHVGNTSRVLPVIASPRVAERIGDKPGEITAAAGRFHVKVVAVRATTPALPDADFLIVNGDDLTNRAATALFVTGGPDGSLDGRGLRAAVAGRTDGAGAGSAAKGTAAGGKSEGAGKAGAAKTGAAKIRVALREEARAGYADSPMQTGAEGIYQAAIGAGAGFAVLAVLLSLLQSAPERTALLSRLRTMGVTRRQGRRLLALEALPQALLAAGGGALVGWATIALLAPGVDLLRLALGIAPDELSALGSSLCADVWSLGVPAAGVVVLTGAVAGVQAWWVARRGSVKELRAGDAR
ncbi:FtsX-like permease family protein [Streptomyces roseicoloratus]|uniref:FtsX-like permease family protein n=1 Tax=Streptomyces roseicoloratus TaxID=2508722 RepID=UPI001009EC8B|nr:FtsX-like permease family protein [Streptomyces roseicoloratus]